jgi:hypothetical protein
MHPASACTATCGDCCVYLLLQALAVMGLVDSTTPIAGSSAGSLVSVSIYDCNAHIGCTMACTGVESKHANTPMAGSSAGSSR